MTLTRESLVDSVYEKLGLTRKESSALVDLAMETIKEQLCFGNPLKISGFGIFKLRHKKARRGRNPRTGDSLMINKRRIMTFAPSRVLRSGINGKVSPRKELLFSDSEPAAHP